MPRYPRNVQARWRSTARESTAAAKVFAKVGHTIRRLRLDRELTLEKLAEKADLSPQHLIDIEHGRTNVTLASMVGIARGLGVRVGELLESV